MRKETLFAVRENSKIARDIYRMVLEGDTSAISAPGQFVNVQIDGLFLRRPISVCDVEAHRLVLVYKVVGVGTAAGGRRRGRSSPLLSGEVPDSQGDCA